MVAFRAVQFPLTEVKLLDGPFYHATRMNLVSLLNYQPDRLLAKFRTEAGLEPKAEHYHGWEDNTIAGHTLGHYLSACALMYQTTGDTEFLKRVNYMVDELAACQEADGDGYIGAFPKGKQILEEEVARGNIRSQGFDLNGIWVPYYTQHKVLMGLMDAHYRCGNQKALAVAVRFADWLATVVENLTDDQIQKMLNCEHGGINEALAEIYAATGEENTSPSPGFSTTGRSWIPWPTERTFFPENMLTPRFPNLWDWHAVMNLPAVKRTARPQNSSGTGWSTTTPM